MKSKKILTQNINSNMDKKYSEVEGTLLNLIIFSKLLMANFKEKDTYFIQCCANKNSDNPESSIFAGSFLNLTKPEDCFKYYRLECVTMLKDNEKNLKVLKNVAHLDFYIFNESVYVSTIKVEKEFRGKNVGSSILKFLEDFVIMKKHNIIFLNSLKKYVLAYENYADDKKSNYVYKIDKNLRFYKKNGFRESKLEDSYYYGLSSLDPTNCNTKFTPMLKKVEYKNLKPIFVPLTCYKRYLMRAFKKKPSVVKR